MLCRPDLDTLRVLPWLDKTALVLCDLFDESTGDAVEVAPRQILRRQIARAARPGTRSSAGRSWSSSSSATATRRRQAAGYAGLTPHSAYVEDYHVLQTTRDEYLIRAIRNGVDNAGIPVEFSKGEAGLGQHEINLEYAEALEMADRHAIYKNAAKEIAGLHGRSLTFMAKYDMGGPGSSCHIHSSVWDADGDTSLMHDPAAPEGMSDVFRGWLGGSLALSRELAWLFAPTVNSYKRYQPESWAPTAIAWGRDNRTCGFRVVGDSATNHRMENRMPGADCNPYLAFAATIAAGLAWCRARRRTARAFRRQRLRGARRGARAAQHRRRHRRARAERRRRGRVRARGARAPGEHGAPGVAGVRHGRHRLGAAPLLRAVLRPEPSGRVAGTLRRSEAWPERPGSGAAKSGKRSTWRATGCVTGSR